MEFKLKKSSQHHSTKGEKATRKHKKMQILSTTKKVKSENIEEDIIIIKNREKTEIKIGTEERIYEVPDYVSLLI